MSIKRDDLKVIFVHSDIDDLGLSLYEFRIYAHIARRAGDGECFPSMPAISKHCKCSVDTAREVIQRLISYGLISRQDRPGNSPLYRLTSVREWKRELVGTLESKSATRKRSKKKSTPLGLGDGSNTPLGLGEGYGIRGGHPSGIDGGHPSGIRGDEVHPPKVIHSKVIQSTSKEPSFHTEFKEGWMKQFKERYGFDYTFGGARDGVAIKTLSKLNLTAKEVLLIADQAWGHSKPFIADVSKTISGLASRINDIRIAVQQGQAKTEEKWFLK